MGGITAVNPCQTRAHPSRSPVSNLIGPGDRTRRPFLVRYRMPETDVSTVTMLRLGQRNYLQMTRIEAIKKLVQAMKGDAANLPNTTVRAKEGTADHIKEVVLADFGREVFLSTLNITLGAVVKLCEKAEGAQAQYNLPVDAISGIRPKEHFEHASYNLRLLLESAPKEAVNLYYTAVDLFDARFGVLFQDSEQAKK